MPDPVAAPAPLRVVLFGPPDAGKSSLLAALSQAAEVQPHLLNGRIAELSSNLLDLRRRIYDRGPAVAAEEVAHYAFAYEPDGGRGRRAVVLDADGRAADAILRDPAPVTGTLSREMLHADALVLAVDASASPEQLDADFADFDRFLGWMEQHRGRRTVVGGLPVFLVLTKCDRLARPGETTADWLEHIEERKREVGDRFHDFLAGRDVLNQPPAFGRIHLHLWATAVGRPALAGVAAKPTEPYGVAELWRQCLDQAAVFRARSEQSAHRLVQMTIAAAGAVVALLAAAGSLVATDALRRPPTQLELRVETLRRDDPKAPEQRLHGPLEQLRSDAGDWRDMRTDPNFAALSVELQAYVEGRLSELDAYVPWLAKLEEAPRPRDALTEEDLRALRKYLDGPLAQPRPAWDETPGGRMRRDLSAEADAMLSAVSGLRTWYGDAFRAGEDLWLSAGRTKNGPSWNGWDKDVEAWLHQWCVPPDADPTERIAGGSPLTYADVKQFGSVASARAQWQSVRLRLRRLRDAAAALGLIEGLPGKPPLLVVPAAGLNLEQAADRFRELQTDYPDYAAAFVQDRSLPSAVASDIADRARANYQLLLEPARALVLAKLRAALPGDSQPADAETPERWRPVREWLRDPKELAGWRGLTGALARLADPDAPDPATALAVFLDTKTFPINLDGFALVVPDALDVKPRPDEALKLSHSSREWLFRPVGEGTRVGMSPFHQYRFQAAAPDQHFDYVPGDGLYAELLLTGGRVFRWDRARSQLYRFEALRNEPVIQGGDRPSAEGVRLQPRPDSGAPRVPDLMPQVDLK